MRSGYDYVIVAMKCEFCGSGRLRKTYPEFALGAVCPHCIRARTFPIRYLENDRLVSSMRDAELYARPYYTRSVYARSVGSIDMKLYWADDVIDYLETKYQVNAPRTETTPAANVEKFIEELLVRSNEKYDEMKEHVKQVASERGWLWTVVQYTKSFKENVINKPMCLEMRGRYEDLIGRISEEMEVWAHNQQIVRELCARADIRRVSTVEARLMPAMLCRRTTPRCLETKVEHVVGRLRALGE